MLLLRCWARKSKGFEVTKTSVSLHFLPIISKWVAQLVKNLPANAKRCKRHGFDPCVGKISWNRKWQPTPVFLPGKSHGQRSLAGYSPWGCKESDRTEHTRTALDRMMNRESEQTPWLLDFKAEEKGRGGLKQFEGGD